ncbi:MAG: ribulose-phosphate 3-epimerase [Verrucomicrobiota bacterium]
MILSLGIKSDPIEYRYSFPWLFRLMADEGVTRLQFGSFFEAYQLPDSYFHRLKKQADDFGITIDSLFTAHRELGGFFQEDQEWEVVARRNFERFIEIGAILGAKSVGSNPGAVPRDLMGTKARGTNCYLAHMKELMHFAKQRGIEWLTVEPMSCLAEPPTLPEEVRKMGETLTSYHAENPETTARVGYCADIAHGYLDQQAGHGFKPVELFEAALPWLYEVHLKNTDERYHSTFGFEPENLTKGIIDVASFRDILLHRAAEIPVKEMTGYLEIGGPKLGRDYTDCQLEDQLRQSLRHLKEVFLAAPETLAAPARQPVVLTVADEARLVKIAPSMMCVDPMNFESALRRVEALGVDMLHMDVMDARFVPNMPLGLSLIEALASKTRLPIDVHLMVEDNDFFIGLLEKSGVAQISVHAESCPHLDRTLSRIREIGAKAGVALNPTTPLASLDYVLERLDYVLLMTVNPGFAGQTMTPASLRKIADCRAYLDRNGFSNLPIQVDGNVSFENIPAMVTAGADCLVAGTSSIFHSGAGWTENIGRVRDSISEVRNRKLAA